MSYYPLVHPPPPSARPTIVSTSREWFFSLFSLLIAYKTGFICSKMPIEAERCLCVGRATFKKAKYFLFTNLTSIWPRRHDTGRVHKRRVTYGRKNLINFGADVKYNNNPHGRVPGEISQPIKNIFSVITYCVRLRARRKKKKTFCSHC